jgi:hypothetical protein
MAHNWHLVTTEFRAVGETGARSFHTNYFQRSFPPSHVNLLSARSFGFLPAGVDLIFFIFAGTFSVYGFDVDGAREFG